MDHGWDGTERRKTQLRETAEQCLADAPPTDDGLPPEQLLHEYRVHQIELEMQNEALCQAQMDLEASRDRYVDLYEFAPVGYLTLTHEGLISEINLTGAALLGEERGRLQQRRFASFVAAEDMGRWHHLFMDALNREGRHDFELALRRGDGAEFHVRVDCRRMVTGEASPVLRIVFADINEQILTQQALEQSRERYRLLFDTITSGVVVYRPEADGERFSIQAINRAAEAMERVRCEDVIGRNLEDVFPTVRTFGLLEVMQRVSRTGVAEHLPVTRYQDARIAGWRENHVYRLDTGEVVAVYDDVSKQVEHALTEKALHAKQFETEEMLRIATDSIRDAFIVIEAEEGTITTWNPAAEAMFGYRREEVLGKALHDFLPAPAHRQAMRQGLEHFARNGKGPAVNKTVELMAVRKDGEEFAIELSISAMTVQGRWHATGIVRDITQRRQHEVQINNLNRILRTISACNQDLVRAGSEADLLQAICRNIIEVGGYQLAWVAYADAPPGAALITIAQWGDAALYRIHAELEQDPDHARHCLTRVALAERQAATCNRLLETDECGFGCLNEAGVQSILALPLLAGEQLFGALTLFSANPDAFDTAEISLMEELAADLAYGIAALRTGGERDHYLTQFNQSMKNTVAAIARTLEMRDPYTAGHQQRVTALALAIAREMGLEETVIEGLYFGAMIHDIGKIAVPAEILAKPTKLSPLEYRLIQAHPETGYDIVKDIAFPWPVANMILKHHERLDGSGYPQGLKGDAICPEARILAVADVVEAMSSHRPYRPGLGVDAALAEIERGSGQYFDPEVVAACVKVVRMNGMLLPE